MARSDTTTGQKIPILVYHHVYAEGSAELGAIEADNGAGVISEAAFRQQMAYLVDREWNVVSTSRVLDWIIDGTSLPPRAVVIHFDNGWLDTVTVALPILQHLDFCATCFPITDGLEAASERRSIEVRTLTEGVIEKPFMTWDHAAELLQAGWEIGAHTATHCRIAERHDEAGDESVIQEAETSNALFEKHLGFVPRHFAYPSGSRNDSTDTILSRYYRSLRLWHFDWPIRWSFTSTDTSQLAIECQNIDVRVPFEDFERIFTEASLT
jgi:peptidoglycan/xylan/chitin deacetylase (PgdA/CDA1 family)